MLNPPKTVEEARKIRYRVWAGNPKGTPYHEGYCVEDVLGGGRILSHQCSRRAVVDGLWCRMHDPEAVKRRVKERTARWQREMNRHPAVRADRYRKALEKIAKEPWVVGLGR